MAAPDEEHEADPFDPKVSNSELGKALRSRSMDERLDWVRAHVLLNPYAALDVGKRLAFSAREARLLVEETIDLGDVSSIRAWIQFYADVAGLKQTLAMIDCWHDEGRRERFKKARYWLGTLRQVQSGEGRKMLMEYLARGSR